MKYSIIETTRNIGTVVVVVVVLIFSGIHLLFPLTKVPLAVIVMCLLEFLILTYVFKNMTFNPRLRLHTVSLLFSLVVCQDKCIDSDSQSSRFSGS